MSATPNVTSYNMRRTVTQITDDAHDKAVEKLEALAVIALSVAALAYNTGPTESPPTAC